MSDFVQELLGAELKRLKALLTPLEKEVTQLQQQLDTKRGTLTEYQEKIKAIEAVIGPQQDRRPANWKNGYAFRAKSHSGGPDHEIVGGRNTVTQYRKLTTELYDWSCNCEAGVFGRECWALTAVKKWLNSGGSVPAGITRVTASSTPFYDQGTERVGDNFGAPRAKLRS